MAFSMAARICVLTLAMALAVVPGAWSQSSGCTVSDPASGLIGALNDITGPGSANYSTLVQFINQAGLTDTINKLDLTGNVTFLAPNNDAFNAFNVTLQQNNLTFADITDKDNNRAASILLYHVITGVGALDVTAVPNGQSLTTMLAGHDLTLSKSANNVPTFIGAVSNATLPNSGLVEIDPCYSKIYIVDSVLLPNATIASIPTYVSVPASVPASGPASGPASVPASGPASGPASFPVGGPAGGPASGASTLAIAGRWTFVVSSALAAALMM